ncbi:DUF3383 family protein [Alicyclobacillus suci]|uniref:DUF3383 family protein n=1 Tax=Alicyclobacillus suci TaxID=2816080 RepID=UPI001A8FD327|nr:DUF3383 family protein [Alicyclobacillus suci]
MPTQSLADIVNVTVEVSAVAPAAGDLNLGLIVGPSTIISDTERTQVYSGTDDMDSDGWTGTEPEYKAAVAYFAQNPRPNAVVIGRQDTTTPETPLQAVTACRASNSDWYGCYVCGATDADIEAIAAYIESVNPAATFFYDTQSADVASGTTPNVMSTLKDSNYQRTFGLYSSTVQYSGAAAMGVAMGLNTGLANSAFTLAYKTLVGIATDDLTTTQVTNIKGWNGNVYTNFGGKYNLLVQGTMADGTPFDQVLNLDTLQIDIQTAVVNALTSATKIPQTDAGVTTLVNVISSVCAQAATEGMIGPGIWNAAPVLGLQTGTNLPNGYIVLADTIANQSEADRAARKSPPIYACVKMSGAIEHVVIGIVVNQ